jgi:threonine dehydrogenase-like Zn-dependent dehydrogenase
MAVPAGHLHAVPHRSAELAALVEPVSVAAMALHRSGLADGDRLVVLGAGPIGLGLVVCAGLAGVGVLVADPLPGRLEVARALGADSLVQTGAEDAPAAVRRWTGGEGADAVVEASGSGAALREAPGMLGRGGRLVVVGLGDGSVTVPVPRLLFEGVSVTGARAGLFPAAVDVVAQRPDDVRRLITHRFPLDRVQQAFAHAHDHPADTVKVLVRV